MSTPHDVTPPRSFYAMTDAQFRAAAREIIATSQTTSEVEQRLKTELGYPCDAVIAAHQSTDGPALEARGIVLALGRTRLASGALVMVTVIGPSGAIVDL